MKYIVLSFDDGLIEFKKYALPILNKFFMKSTVNIVTGFSDKTVPNNFSFLTIKDIKQLFEEGHEIAAHSNSHLDYETVEDMELSIKKIIDWTGQSSVGVVMPKSQDITDELCSFFESTQSVYYYADWRYKKIKMHFKGHFHRIINHLKRNKKSGIITYGFSVLYNPRFLKRNKKPRFDRITVKKDRESKYFIDFLKRMPDNNCVTIVFHSILNNYAEKCDWPEGAWNIEEFENLLAFINSRKDMMVLTQKEAIQKMIN